MLRKSSFMRNTLRAQSPMTLLSLRSPRLLPVGTSLDQAACLTLGQAHPEFPRHAGWLAGDSYKRMVSMDGEDPVDMVLGEGEIHGCLPEPHPAPSPVL